MHTKIDFKRKIYMSIQQINAVDLEILLKIANNILELKLENKTTDILQQFLLLSNNILQHIPIKILLDNLDSSFDTILQILTRLDTTSQEQILENLIDSSNNLKILELCKCLKLNNLTAYALIKLDIREDAFKYCTDNIMRILVDIIQMTRVTLPLPISETIDTLITAKKELAQKYLSFSEIHRKLLDKALIKLFERKRDTDNFIKLAKLRDRYRSTESLPNNEDLQKYFSYKSTYNEKPMSDVDTYNYTNLPLSDIRTKYSAKPRAHGCSNNLNIINNLIGVGRTEDAYTFFKQTHDGGTDECCLHCGCISYLIKYKKVDDCILMACNSGQYPIRFNTLLNIFTEMSDIIDVTKYKKYIAMAEDTDLKNYLLFLLAGFRFSGFVIIGEKIDDILED